MVVGVSLEVGVVLWAWFRKTGGVFCGRDHAGLGFCGRGFTRGFGSGSVVWFSGRGFRRAVISDTRVLRVWFLKTCFFFVGVVM